MNGNASKLCKHCGETKPRDELHWYFAKGVPVHPCRECTKRRARQRDARNRDDVIARRRARYHQNAEKFRSQKRAWSANRRDELAEYQRLHREVNGDRLNEILRERRSRNRDEINKRQRDWFASNPERASVYQQKRYSSAEYRIIDSLGRSIRAVLSSAGAKKKKSKFAILPYSQEDLIQHLESLFEERMSLENFGEWHVDHVVPKSKFSLEDYEDEDEFIRAVWALRNLAPLWASDNAQKSDRLDWSLPDTYRNRLLRAIYCPVELEAAA